MPPRFLILDPSGTELTTLADCFREVAPEPARVHTVATRTELESALDQRWDLLIVDAELGDGERDGHEVLRAVCADDADQPVVMVAAKGDVSSAASAVRAGATDFLVRGDRLGERVSIQLGKVRALLRVLHDNRALLRIDKLLAEQEHARYRIRGRAPQLREVLAMVERIARVPRPVLVVGERGTGKELITRAIHAASGAGGAFVPVNCAAFSGDLLENELFGHERGAFTGADHRAVGKFELADGGTLFLDEIGHMTPAFQRKILRAVEYGTFTRVGGSQEIRVATRIIAATNADLPAMVKSGDFLADLYDRLAFEVIRVPPLREREGDVELLAHEFFELFMQEVPELAGKRLSKGAIAMLVEHSFPGNVRELKTIIERAVYRDTTNELTPEDIGVLRGPGTRSALTGGFKERTVAFERELVRGAMAEASGNQAEAARRLGLSYHQFRYYLRKHGT